VLRDTDHGFRYLEKTDTGDRVVKEKLRTSAGRPVSARSRTIPPTASFRFRASTGSRATLLKKKIQLNVFFAGAYAFVNLTDPSVRGASSIWASKLRSSAIKLDDKLYVAGEEDVAQRVRRRSQYLTAGSAAAGGFLQVLARSARSPGRSTTTAPRRGTRSRRKTPRTERACRSCCRRAIRSTPAACRWNSIARGTR
jgi:hypothetical protein